MRGSRPETPHLLEEYLKATFARASREEAFMAQFMSNDRLARLSGTLVSLETDPHPDRRCRLNIILLPRVCSTGRL